jgi:hypothetical protein
MNGSRIALRSDGRNLARMRRGFHPSLRLSLGLGLCLTAAAWSSSASACSYTAETRIRPAPPANLTDPAEIEAWEERQDDIYDAYRMVAREQEWREHKAMLEVEALQAPSFSAGTLAESLAANLVPPLLPQFAYHDSCGDLHGPELMDPVGYLRMDSAEATAQLVEFGILESADDRDLLPARFERELPYAWPSCTQEARERVRQRFTERFTQSELAHVWGTLHRLDFDYSAVEEPATTRSGPQAYRLLRFKSGRSGSLEVSTDAKPSAFGRPFTWAISAGHKKDTAELRQFLSQDPVAVRLVAEVEGALSGAGVERCPQTGAEMAQIAADVRAQIAQRRRPRQARN